ncbi:MAG: hypothetical protein CME55_06655 [Halieaceae bacterium]|nr:hypothetical protein [Halieaceae bacterium]|tara:strand:- start:16517 stop:16849 length:333 start_codon:yes stop_codon:yes gene_type:complete
MGLYIPDTFCYLAKFQQPLEKWNIHAQNYKLIADAPLFLEEVKRLNALIHRDYDWLKSNYPKVFDEMMMSKLYGDLQVEMPNAFDEDDTCWLYHESGSDGTIDKFNPIED